MIKEHQYHDELKKAEKAMEQLKELEKQLDHKDNNISELKKKNMMQEGAIASWIEAMDEKKKLLKDKEKRCNEMEQEIQSLMKRNAQFKHSQEKLEEELIEAQASLAKLEVDKQNLEQLDGDNNFLRRRVQELERMASLSEQ